MQTLFWTKFTSQQFVLYLICITISFQSYKSLPTRIAGPVNGISIDDLSAPVRQCWYICQECEKFAGWDVVDLRTCALWCKDTNGTIRSNECQNLYDLAVGRQPITVESVSTKDSDRDEKTVSSSISTQTTQITQTTPSPTILTTMPPEIDALYNMTSYTNNSTEDESTGVLHTNETISTEMEYLNVTSLYTEDGDDEFISQTTIGPWNDETETEQYFSANYSITEAIMQNKDEVTVFNVTP